MRTNSFNLLFYYLAGWWLLVCKVFEHYESIKKKIKVYLCFEVKIRKDYELIWKRKIITILVTIKLSSILFQGCKYKKLYVFNY